MEAEIIGALATAVAGLAATIGILLRRDNKASHGNPGSNAHLAKLEALGEQQVEALGEVRAALTVIQVTLGKLEVIVGTCGAVQELRRRGG